MLISEWILFQRGRPGSLPGTQNFVAVLARQLRLHAILLSPPLSLSLSLAPPYPLQLWIRNKQVRCSLDWMWCVAWTTEGQGLGSVGLDARLEKKWGGGCLCVSLRHSHLAPWLARTDCWVGWLAHRQQPPTPPSPAHLPLVLLLPRSVLLMIRFGSGSTSAAWTSGWRFFILQPWYGHSTCALQQKRQAHTASASVGDGLRE